MHYSHIKLALLQSDVFRRLTDHQQNTGWAWSTEIKLRFEQMTDSKRYWTYCCDRVRVRRQSFQTLSSLHVPYTHTLVKLKATKTMSKLSHSLLHISRNKISTWKQQNKNKKNKKKQQQKCKYAFISMSENLPSSFSFNNSVLHSSVYCS